MSQIIQFRRDTAANWTAANPILAQGELGLELGTNQLKMGDGTTAWNSLSYTQEAPVNAHATTANLHFPTGGLSRQVVVMGTSGNLEWVNYAYGINTIERGFIGEAVAGDVIRIFIPSAAKILSATVVSAVQPSTEDCLVDIRKNGTTVTDSIFVSDIPITLATTATATNTVYTATGTLDDARVALNAKDVLYVYVLQAGNTADLSICLEVLY